MADNSPSEKSVTITDNASGKSTILPVTSGTVGPDVIDIRKLYTETGMFTFDPGYGATGSSFSGLTYIDGDEGVLLHRGYAIEELAEKGLKMRDIGLPLRAAVTGTKQPPSIIDIMVALGQSETSVRLQIACK